MRLLLNQIKAFQEVITLDNDCQSVIVRGLLSCMLQKDMDVAIMATREGMRYQIMSDGDLDFFNDYVNASPDAQFFTTPAEAAIAYITCRSCWVKAKEINELSQENEAIQETLRQEQMEHQRTANDMGEEITRLQLHIELHKNDWNDGNLIGFNQGRDSLLRNFDN